MNRTISTYGKYFLDFYSALDEDVQAKIDYVFELVKSLDVIPKRFFQHLDDGIFEIRVEFESNIYRIFCFSMQDTWLYYSTLFKRKLKRHPNRNWN